MRRGVAASASPADARPRVAAPAPTATVSVTAPALSTASVAAAAPPAEARPRAAAPTPTATVSVTAPTPRIEEVTKTAGEGAGAPPKADAPPNAGAPPKAGPGAEERFRLGESALFNRNFQRAVEQFQLALDHKEDLEPRQRQLSRLGIAVARHNRPMAQEIAREISRRWPDDPDLARIRTEFGLEGQRPFGRRRQRP
jgi:hypothetical protein